MAKIAFIGLGVMGFPMAGHLAKAGHDVCVYNRTKTKADGWCHDYPGRAAATPFDAAQGADFVFVCVGNDNDVRAVVFGEEGCLAAMQEGSVLVDHTTASADLAYELNQACATRHVHCLDAPVSGGQAGAENGALAIMCGGAETCFHQVEPIMQAYGKTITLMGTAGAGQMAKMVNQICIAGAVQGLSEGLALAKACGLEADKLLGTLSQGAAGSWQMNNRGQTMMDGVFDFGFAIDWMRKDLGIALTHANAQGISLPMTALVDQFYAELQAMGAGRQDTSALIRRLDKGV